MPWRVDALIVHFWICSLGEDSRGMNRTQDDVTTWDTYRITGPLRGDSPHKGQLMRNFICYFVGSLNELLMKQSIYR